MENFFARLQQNNRYYESASPAYLSTHPLTVERISDMENRTQQLGNRAHTDSMDFLLIQQRMRVLQESSHNERLKVEKEIRDDLASAKNQRQKIALTYGLSVANRRLVREQKPSVLLMKRFVWVANSRFWKRTNRSAFSFLATPMKNAKLCVKQKILWTTTRYRKWPSSFTPMSFMSRSAITTS